MKPKKSVSYFPVSPAEQDLLLRVREPDLAERTEDLLTMLGAIAEVGLTPGDLDQAIQMLLASRQGEGLEARFDNLEARLKQRVEQGLSEIEGRLSRRMADPTPEGAPVPAPVRPTAVVPPPVIPPPVIPPADELPREASVAFRVDGELVWGPSAAQFYVAVWRWLFQHGRVGLADLPIRSGKSRYSVALEPVHPSGNAFTRAEQPIPGVFAEVNLSRSDILRRTVKLLGRYEVPFEVVVGDP